MEGIVVVVVVVVVGSSCPTCSTCVSTSGTTKSVALAIAVILRSESPIESKRMVVEMSFFMVGG